MPYAVSIYARDMQVICPCAVSIYASDMPMLHHSPARHFPIAEVGTIGGGTSLTAQASCLDMLGVRGSNEVPGSNAQKLAKIICATVLAGEISLAAALTSGHLISAHMSLNRKVPAPPTRPAAGGPERSPSTQLRGQRVRRCVG